ncbi:MAG: DUF4173 domain-containing protein [Crocinitomicaceae bacterium]|nr:DUF4173 domain-containing protein [Crocinitomicaceae bacterium]MBK8924371.1 DUF4173 domain-containing protein [Crocinitomicaceae bacterium]
MKRQHMLYLGWSLLVANLIYQELWGLNIFIITGISAVLAWYHYFKSPTNNVSPHKNAFRWYLSGIIWFISAFSVFLSGSTVPIILYVLSTIYFISVQDRSASVSIIFSLSQILYSFSKGFVDFILIFFKKGDQENRMSRRLKLVLIVTTGLIIFICFLKLYQLADPSFYELTAFITLDWISWDFLIFWLLITWLLYGLYYYHGNQAISEFDQTFQNDVPAGYSDFLQRYLGEKSEYIATIAIAGMLSLLGTVYLINDIYQLTALSSNERSFSDYSEAVHEGVYSLMFSIFLVVLVISLFFRGVNNFAAKTPRNIALIWLLVNCGMIITTTLKNMDYISYLGLTHKRIGVLFYLLICIVSLIVCLIKLVKIKSFWFLIRSSAVSILFLLVIFFTINWNKIITEYNLKNIELSRLDFDYLYSIGNDTHPALLQYHVKYGITDTDFYHTLCTSVKYTRNRMRTTVVPTAWRSFCLHDYLFLRELEKFKFASDEIDSNRETDDQASRYPSHSEERSLR